MSSDDRTSSKKSIIVLFLLFCMLLIAMCYIHAFVGVPPPLISIKRRRNESLTGIFDNTFKAVINDTPNFYTQYKRKHVTKTLSVFQKKIEHAILAERGKKIIYCENINLENGGPIEPNKTLVSLDSVESELGPLLKPGGAFEPKDCKAKYHVAIIIPFRDRYAHLSIFLRNIHPFLMKQNIAYRIFVIEQTNDHLFNRAALMNVGFLEALKVFNWNCFIFHDVDLLPLDDRNLYNCPRQPRHMSVAVDVFNYKLPYRTIFGGVSAMTRKQFEKVNGFSNVYFGWGGEDDDMYNRIKHGGYFVSRYPENIARYTMLKHQPEKANPKRWEHLANSLNKFKTDGLNSLHYVVNSSKEFPTFTWYLIELKIIEPNKQETR